MTTIEEQRALTVKKLLAYASSLQDRPAASAWSLIANLTGSLVDSLSDQALIIHEQLEVMKTLGTVIEDQGTQIALLQSDLAASAKRIDQLERSVTNGDTP